MTDSKRKYFGENPIHPGIIIRERYFKPLNLTNAAFLKDSDISTSQFSRLLNGKTDISYPMARELGRLFDVAPNVFLALQDRYKLGLLEAEDNWDQKDASPVEGGKKVQSG